VCSYPDILQESNGQRVYRYTIPGWTQNGERLFPDGVKFTTSTNSQTSESLMINTAMMSYSDMMSLNLRCYLVFNVNQTNKESNPQSISPPVVSSEDLQPALSSDGVTMNISTQCSSLLPEYMMFNILVKHEDRIVININTSTTSVPLSNLDANKQYSVTVKAIILISGEVTISSAMPIVIGNAQGGASGMSCGLVCILPPVVGCILLIFIS
jgi:hypothetical protein